MLLRVFLVVCFVCVVAGSDFSGPAAPESLHVNGVSVKSPLTVAADDSFTLTFATRHSQRGAVQVRHFPRYHRILYSISTRFRAGFIEFHRFTVP